MACVAIFSSSRLSGTYDVTSIFFLPSELSFERIEFDSEPYTCIDFKLHGKYFWEKSVANRTNEKKLFGKMNKLLAVRPLLRSVISSNGKETICHQF